MKGIIIYEDYRGKKVVEAVKLGAVNYTCKSEDSDWVSELSGIRKESTQAYYNKDDTYDFEVGALIALMKMCGFDKSYKAIEEAFKYNSYVGKKTKELEEENKELKKQKEQIIVAKNVLYNKLDEEFKRLKDKNSRQFEYIKEKDEEIKKLEEENKMLCGKIKFLDKENRNLVYGGRQNGKQYTALVNMFKKLDQKKVDAAYKEAYNTTLPVWQKEVLKQMYDVYKESKEKIELPRTLDINGTVYRKSIQIKEFGEQINKLTVDSLIEQSRAFTRKCVDEWLYRIPTKRDEMWEKIIGASKCPPVEIKVAKQDITTFLRELQDKIPEARWNGSDCLPLEYTNPYWFKHDYIYFALFRNDNKLKLCYSEEHHSWIKTTIDYLPPMRWDLFEKGRKIVRVTPDNIDEFIVKCTNKFGSIMKPVLKRYKDFTHVFVMISDYHYDNKPTIHIMTPEDLVRNQHENSKKYSDKKIVDWEDVR